jgi:SAM-dependent methyltransferase
VTDSGLRASLDAEYFDRLYARERDPWRFETSEYENGKYRATLAALEGRRFRRALEIGCSIGVLTALLADRVDSLLSVDVSERALAVARRRCRRKQNVRFAQMSLPHQFPPGPFDLVLISEVGYYWDARDLALAIDRVAEAAAGGTVELVHFLPKVADYPLSGDEVHDAFLADPRYARRTGTRAERYRIDVLEVRR